MIDPFERQNFTKLQQLDLLVGVHMTLDDLRETYLTFDVGERIIEVAHGMSKKKLRKGSKRVREFFGLE